MTDSHGTNNMVPEPNEEPLTFRQSVHTRDSPPEPVGHMPTQSPAPTCLVQIPKTVYPKQVVQSVYIAPKLVTFMVSKYVG